MVAPGVGSNGWSPARVRGEFGLALTGAEREKIRAKFPPTASPGPGVYYADGVFEGGGVLGLAFLGAARCCGEVGIRWRGLAGTSVGAITASLLAAIPSVDDLEEVFGGVDFLSFVGEKTSRLILDYDPSNDLDNPAQMLLMLLLANQLGQYSSEPLRAWLEGALKRGGVTTFSDIGPGEPERQLKVVVSDITRGQMLVIPDDLPEDQRRSFPVAEAVRLSMSIPLFFVPGRLNDALVVDGGILSNYPVWIYDEKDPAKEPRWPTFGFRLSDARDGQPLQIRGAPDILKAMFKTMMYAHDRYNTSKQKRTRTVNVDLTGVGVSATQFNLTDDRKDELYRRGYESTKRFLLDEWDWQAHLESRGFAAN